MFVRIVIILSVLFLVIQARAQESLPQLMQIPNDTLDMANMRIWIPVERYPKERVKIDIRARSGMLTRHFFQGEMPKGYHNFYWDKKDDSGLYVPEGVYRFQARIGRESRFGELTVQYRRGERESEVYSVGEKRPLEMNYVLKDDTARVTITVLNPRGDTLAIPISDSLMKKGTYQFRYSPTDRICPSRYGSRCGWMNSFGRRWSCMINRKRIQMNLRIYIFSLITFVVIVMAIGCGRPKTVYNMPEIPLDGYYDYAWVEPKIVFSDDVMTLIRADRLDSIYIARPPQVEQKTAPTLIFNITQPECFTSINLMNLHGEVVYPLMAQNLPFGAYKFLSADPAFEQSS